jgi:hypothetical protein
MKAKKLFHFWENDFSLLRRRIISVIFFVQVIVLGFSQDFFTWHFSKINLYGGGVVASTLEWLGLPAVLSLFLPARIIDILVLPIFFVLYFFIKERWMKEMRARVQVGIVLGLIFGLSFLGAYILNFIFLGKAFVWLVVIGVIFASVFTYHYDWKSGIGIATGIAFTAGLIFSLWEGIIVGLVVLFVILLLVITAMTIISLSFPESTKNKKTRR